MAEKLVTKAPVGCVRPRRCESMVLPLAEVAKKLYSGLLGTPGKPASSGEGEAESATDKGRAEIKCPSQGGRIVVRL